MTQKVINGIEHLQETLSGATKVFVVSDSSFPFLNIKDDIENMGYPHVIFSDFSPNPVYEDDCKGIDLYHITKCDCILAVGGGSVIDSAKAIAMGVCYNGDFWDFYSYTAQPKAALPVATILTIAAAGSEGSPDTVITKKDGMVKRGLETTCYVRNSLF